jgi:flagellar hook-length control protein FliK
VKGGEIMQSVSVKDIVKNIASNESKVRSSLKKDSDNTFSNVLKSKAKSETSSKKEASDIKEAVNVGTEEEMPEKDVKTEEFDRIVQLLINSDSLNKGELNIDELKQLISELLNDNLSEMPLDSNVGTSYNLLGIEQLNLESVSSLPLNFKDQLKTAIDNLSTQIFDVLVSDSNPKVSDNLKSDFMEKLQTVSGQVSTEDNGELKKTILAELIKMLRNGESDEAMQQDTDIINFDVKDEQKVETFDGLLQKNSETLNLIETKSTSKEDKLLKSLADNNPSKDNKDNLNSKISNVMARFEAIRNDNSVAAEAPVVINRSTFNADFIKAVKFMEVNNVKELSVKIIPKDLGEITIRLSMDNGVMKANITAANKETYNLLNAQLPAISNQLAEQNMNIQSFNLSLYNGDNFFFNGDGSSEGDNRRQGKGNARVLALEDEEPVGEDYSQENSVNILA